MNSYDKNVQIYISNFKNIYHKLKNMSYIIEFWLLNNTFIDELKDQYDNFIRTKLNELQDFKNKNTITEINLNELIDQITAHILNYNFKNKNRDKKSKSFNTESKNDSKSKSNSNQTDQTDQIKVNDKLKSGDKEKQIFNNQSNNSNVNNNQSDSDW